MIKTWDMYNGIKDALAVGFPDRICYIGGIPKEPVKPSFLIEFIDSFINDKNISTVSRIEYYLITGYETGGSDIIANVENLIVTQDEVLDCFKSGKLTVGDRKLNVSASIVGKSEDIFYIDLKVEYFDDKGIEQESIPYMEEINVNKKYV